ncbi:ComEC/Rec2 family competence protein [Methylorubrum populi]|uniref:DNA internalization competence protein ComEC/Rec2 n=1 Tax=Methylorubrum populi TaxID=223967 RepID=A0A833MYF1_9HYPH|nr:ComEC/Rec2 family competence protein [Methylorubrum populi]KAB7782383.1 DNA internalization competence protein ComEC/Rec2 [Methylorubrum populi]
MMQGGGRAMRGAVPALLAGRVIAPAQLWPATRDRLRAGLACEAEQRRLFPWLAVAFGAGILVFFTATDGEPALAAPLMAAGLSLVVTPVLRARPVALALMLALTAFFLGFAAGVWRVASVAGPVLSRITIAPLAGIVEGLDERESGARLIVRVDSFGDLDAEHRPRRVRVSYRAAQTVRPGDAIRATARLLPPPEAARPGGYDFARDAYFRGIGAVGSLVGKVEVGPPPERLPLALRLAAAIDTARNAFTHRITDAIGGQAGAVAAALVTGKRGLISNETNEVLRAAGIYHVVSISGLHMVLAAGVVFWLVRAGLALVPALALAWPIKKIAAGAAMLGVTAYCAFSGWDVAAERALIMTLIMLGAILVDRPALSMRNLALAAMLALAREPEALLGPSFQMSFGAVAGLIACAPLLDGRVFRTDSPSRIARAASWLATAVVGTLATTLVAQIATAPFATYHFQTMQPFGLVGNALTLPLVSLAVMPAAVLGMLAYPFALDRPVWWLMGLAVRGMLDISAWIAGFGQANVVLPAFGTGALVLLAVALLVATLPVSRLRLLALLPACLGIALAASPTRYDIYIDRDGAGAAVRGKDGRLVVLGRPPGFVLEQWLKADGDGRRPETVTGAAGPRCDRLGCTVLTLDGRAVALVTDKRAFPEDCARADILISRLRAPPGCAAPLIADRTFLAAQGATAIRLGATGPEVASTRGAGPPKPWQPRPPATAAMPAAAPEPSAASDPGAADPTDPLPAEPPQ